MKYNNYIEGFSGDLNISLELPENELERRVGIDSWVEFKNNVNLNFLKLRRLKNLVQHIRPFPFVKRKFISSIESKNWVVYFCYLPDGKLSIIHKYTLSQLKQQGFSILVVCACPDFNKAPSFKDYDIDGLVLKELKGYDFSGYTAGLSYLADQERDYNVVVLNDSILGPFTNLKKVFQNSPWQLTGCLTYDVIENHMVSFYFSLKNFNKKMFRSLNSVFMTNISFNSQGPVVLLQETRLAAEASKKMTAGSILCAPKGIKAHNYIMGNPIGLLDIGFPFIKRSIFEKRAHLFNQEYYLPILEELGHPTFYYK